MAKKSSTKEKPSLFIGRWQPFHEGHKKLVETVLKSGKPVVIAIRDTQQDEKNPYTVEERADIIRHELKEYGNLVEVVAIPDIDEVCYGRDVGYLIRRINLDAKTESISGTKIRQDNQTQHDIIWLTGQSGAGKTTLARALAPMLGAVVLDGDEMRESISMNAGFSKEDRDANNFRIARLASVLARRTPVIVSVIAPFEETRQQINEMISPVWVHVDRNLPVIKDRPYESPLHADITVTVDEDADPEKNAGRVHARLKELTGSKMI